MSEKQPGADDKDLHNVLAELDGILAELDGILAEVKGSPAPPPPPLADVPPVAKAVPPPPPAPAQAAEPAPPKPAPAFVLDIPPVVKPVLPPLSAPAKAAEPAPAKLAPAAAVDIPPVAKPVSAPLPAGAAPSKPTIELAPMSGIIKPPEKKPEGPKAAPKPATLEVKAPLELKIKPDAPAVQPAPPPGDSAAASAVDQNLDKVPKDQIRRVVFLHAPQQREKLDVLEAFLEKSCLTISKQPLYMRKVFRQEFTTATDPHELSAKARALGVVAVIGVLQGLPERLVGELGQTLSNDGMLFRTVDPADVQKKFMVVDLVVDMLLLPHET